MKHSTHGNGNGYNDLYILPESLDETARILAFLKRIDHSYVWSVSDVEGQDWHGRHFFDIPFGESLLGEIQQAAAPPRRWVAKFQGRKAGSLGIWYPVTTEVEAHDEEAARLALYDRFDHISGLALEPAMESQETAAQGS